jgi:lysophospholipase L1-like esterase
MDELAVSRHGYGLERTFEAIQGGQLTLGFTGGSITDPRPGHNWPEAVAAWFVETFPGTRIVVENAAIGATGSELAVLRARRDLVERGCNLVFIEYAVNDGGEPAEKRMRTREGLIRKLLAGEGRDLVLVYTYAQDMYPDMLAGRVPPSIADFEALGRHYGIGSVWMGLHALQEVQRGRMRWEEWLPDGLHPQSRGSLAYADSVIHFLEEELFAVTSRGRLPSGAGVPEPLNALNWEHAYSLPFSVVKTRGPWTVQRASRCVWMDQLLCTAAPGAGLSFGFAGRGLSLGFDFGRSSAEFRYCLDHGEWRDSNRDRPAWCGEDGWYRVWHLADDLPPDTHTFDLEVVHGNCAGCSGTNFRLAAIGVIP